MTELGFKPQSLTLKQLANINCPLRSSPPWKGEGTNMSYTPFPGSEFEEVGGENLGDCSFLWREEGVWVG